MKFKHIDTCWYFNKLDHRGKPYDWPCCGETTECDEAFVKALQDENIRLREALNFIVNNASSWGLEAEEYVRRARSALEGKG